MYKTKRTLHLFVDSSVYEALIFLALLMIITIPTASCMGLSNMLNTLMNTAYSLLINTSFYIMAIAVMMGALSAILTEFGVTKLLNRLLSPLMRPVYGLPGAAALGVVTTYLSDNPAIISLAEDTGFRSLFKKYQIPALTNIGTAFGMGLIVTTFMLGLEGSAGVSLLPAALIGNLGALVGSIVSTRLMLSVTKKRFGKEEDACLEKTGNNKSECIKKTPLGERLMNAVLSGGKSGVELGLAIIPGVLVICTLVLLLTNGMPDGGYTGAVGEGVAVLPKIAELLKPVLVPLFGFSSPDCISIPITALGSAGAAMGLVPQLLNAGLANAHDVAVFTSMCMCWSGFLSTHVSMMEALGCSELAGKAILCHTVGGIAAGAAANWLYKLVILII